MGGVAPVGRGRGGEAGEGGHGSASLPSIGPQPRQGARPAPGWGLLSGSGSAPAQQVPAAAGELRVHRAVTWKPAACTPAVTGKPRECTPKFTWDPQISTPKVTKEPCGNLEP